MIPIYQVFRVLAGLIISGFILFFLVSYLVTYSSMQESIKASKIIGNFKKAADTVYISGTLLPFSDFSQTDSMFFTDVSGEPGIVSDTGNVPKVPLDMPVFLVQGDLVLIGRGSLDFGWWKFHYVSAMPDMQVYFNPLENEPESWELVEEMASVFPDSRGYDIKVTFGFCDGNKLKSGLCGTENKEPCERRGFLDVVETLKEGGGAEFAACDAEIGGSSRVIAISQRCSEYPGGFGLCVSPPNSEGIGNVYAGDKVWLYKDPVDIFAFILGGPERGEDLFTLKNGLQQRELTLAAESGEKRYREMADRISGLVSEGELAENSDDAKCIDILYRLSGELRGLEETVSGEGYYLNLDAVSSYRSSLEDLDASWREAVSLGCVYEA